MQAVLPKPYVALSVVGVLTSIDPLRIQEIVSKDKEFPTDMLSVNYNGNLGMSELIYNDSKGKVPLRDVLNLNNNEAQNALVNFKAYAFPDLKRSRRVDTDNYVFQMANILERTSEYTTRYQEFVKNIDDRVNTKFYNHWTALLEAKKILGKPITSLDKLILA